LIFQTGTSRGPNIRHRGDSGRNGRDHRHDRTKG
jgi:hypothetical protein